VTEDTDLDIKAEAARELLKGHKKKYMPGVMSRFSSLFKRRRQ